MLTAAGRKKVRHATAVYPHLEMRSVVDDQAIFVQQMRGTRLYEGDSVDIHWKFNPLEVDPPAAVKKPWWSVLVGFLT